MDISIIVGFKWLIEQTSTLLKNSNRRQSLVTKLYLVSNTYCYVRKCIFLSYQFACAFTIARYSTQISLLFSDCNCYIHVNYNIYADEEENHVK